MFRYSLRRILGSIPLLLLITAFVFALLQAAPGGPLSTGEGGGGTAEEAMSRMRVQWGLDQPVHLQFVRWLGQLLQGEWGSSFNSGQPVLELILQRLPATLQLTGLSLLLSMVLVIPLGTLAALRKRSWIDYAITGVSISGISMPIFWLALMLLYVFSFNLGWLPSAGLGDIRASTEGWAAVAERLRYLALPVTCFTLVTVAGLVRFMRGSMLDTLEQDYIRTVRSKGLPARTVIGKHALRNALIPVVTMFAMELPRLFIGSVVIETIFALPGVGRLFIDSVQARDYPVLMGILVIASVLVVVSNLVADLLCGWLDPRIALGKE